jgi:hypothetical protein
LVYQTSQPEATTSSRGGGDVAAQALGQILSLDTITNAALDRLCRWTPDLPRTEATIYLLRYMLARLFLAGSGNVARARFQACQQTIGSRIYGGQPGISREWTNKLLGRLVEAGWIDRLTIKLTADRHAPCIFSAGRQLKRLIISLLKSLRPRPRPGPAARPSLISVNSQSHSSPLLEEHEKLLSLTEQVALVRQRLRAHRG